MKLKLGDQIFSDMLNELELFFGIFGLRHSEKFHSADLKILPAKKPTEKVN